MGLEGHTGNRQSFPSGGPLVTLLAFAAGLVIGLVVLGWYVFPVQWTKAGPGDLAGGYREDYLAMVAESYARNGNVELARRRLRTFDPVTINQAAETLNSLGLAVEAQQVRALASLVPGTPGALAATQTPATALRLTPGPPATVQVPASTPLDSSLPRRLALIGMVCLVAGVVVTGGILGVTWLARRPTLQVWLRRDSGPTATKPSAQTPLRVPPRVSPAQPGPGWEISEVVVGEVVSTEYVPGDVRYRESYQIKNLKGEILGECGVRIAETLSGPDRQRPPAFDIWLYDRLDDRTVKDVVLTEQAFSDRAQRRQLAGNGRPDVPAPDKILLLETANLLLDATLVDFEYGLSPDPSAQPFFDRFVVQLKPTLRVEAGQDEQEPL